MKKRYRIKKKYKKIFTLLIILIPVSLILINFNNIKKIYLSKTTGYSPNTIEVFLDNNIYKEISSHEYSKTLEVILNTKYYDEKHLKEYLNINYINDDSFITNTAVLLDKGYNSKDINTIYDKLNTESINILTEKDYIKEISAIISIDYFSEEKLERYINYYNKEKLDIDNTVLYVNIGLDNEYYTNVNAIEKQDDILVLVNKYNKLSNDYIPNDLITISSNYGGGKFKKEAGLAFEKMCEAAKKDNIYIYNGSSYRSYSYQNNLYNNYVARDGKKAADTFSARAGHSEHQTGLATDIRKKNYDFLNEEDKEFTWLEKNSYKYGYILRYLKGKENITGYKYEPWHYRYVGIEIAKELHDLNITYEEYIAKK